MIGIVCVCGRICVFMWETKQEKLVGKEKGGMEVGERRGRERERSSFTFSPFILYELLRESSLEWYPVFAWRLIHIKCRISKLFFFFFVMFLQVNWWNIQLTRWANKGQFSDSFPIGPFGTTFFRDNLCRQGSCFPYALGGAHSNLSGPYVKLW